MPRFIKSTSMSFLHPLWAYTQAVSSIYDFICGAVGCRPTDLCGAAFECIPHHAVLEMSQYVLYVSKVGNFSELGMIESRVVVN